MSENKTASPSAATNVIEFLQDLDGGQFESLLSVALSDVAIGVTDSEKKKGNVTLNFEFESIPGTSQVRVKHTIKFTRPTLDGKKTEEITRDTPMHVGKYGALSITPTNQLAMFDRSGNPANAEQPC